MNRLFLNLQKAVVNEIECVCGLHGLSYKRELRFEAPFKALFGFGERFDSLNQIGLKRKIQVFETFTEQGSDTYLPIPFCLSDTGFGVYIDTKRVINISSILPNGTDEFSAFYSELPPDGADIHFFHGAPSDILNIYSQLTGRPKLPPDWSFGLWMSANRWNTQKMVEAEVAESINQNMKPSVIVIEAWSDETTFYRFDPKCWPDPAGMIQKLHELNIKCLLWQIPVLKKLEKSQFCPEHDNDCAFAVEHGYLVLNPDGTPYTIPEGRWFGGSMIPDFTNPYAYDWWFSKRQHLLDIGVDGFKTDGGEFLYDDKPCFYNGSTGADMQNGYAIAYTNAYSQFVGDERVLFSRAGFTGSQTTPLHWAGDQRSTWEELRHVLTAGLNAGLSGIPFWGFDIAGFAGELPSVELYLRAFALACFSPIMQWHSEPVGGQFAEMMASNEKFNDRSPWNIAAHYNRPDVLDICKKFIDERGKLQPYLLREAAYCSQTGRPLMAPLFFDAYSDRHAYAVSDQFMLGREMMIAPVLWEGATEREVYFPEGKWRDYWTNEVIEGNSTRIMSCAVPHLPVFVLERKQS